jgi:hypothetical protein
MLFIFFTPHKDLCLITYLHLGFTQTTYTTLRKIYYQLSNKATGPPGSDVGSRGCSWCVVWRLATADDQNSRLKGDLSRRVLGDPWLDAGLALELGRLVQT